MKLARASASAVEEIFGLLGQPPLRRSQPPRLSRDLLVRSIAYRLQELAHGGLSKAMRRKLLALTKVLQSNGSIEPDEATRSSASACRKTQR